MPPEREIQNMLISINTKLAEVSSDVKYTRDNLDEHKSALTKHIEHDELVTKEFLRPLWEESQQRKGAAKLAGLLYSMTGATCALLGEWFIGGHK